jgi:hypothetical protein
MASLSYDYSLSNNTVADATHVMSNFNKVKTFVEASTVQVDGSVQAGTAAIANGAVTVDKLSAAVPRGVIAKEIKTTNSATGANVNCFTGISFTPVVGRLYRVSFGGFLAIGTTDFLTTYEVAFVDNTNGIIQYISQSGTINSGAQYVSSLSDSYLIAPVSATSVTLNVRANRIGGTDTFYFNGAANKQNYLLVEDLGLA